MLIYNQGIQYVFFDLDNLSDDFFQTSEYVVKINEYLSNAIYYALYTNEENYTQFISMVEREISIKIVPIQLSTFQPIFPSIKELDINLLQGILITSNLDNINQAHGEHLNTMYIKSANQSLERTKLPDCVVGSVEELVNYLNGNSDGFYNENIACNPSSKGGKIFIEEIRHPLDENISSVLYTGGRYFTSADPRSYVHTLTSKILNFKDGTKETIGTQLASIVKKNIDYISKKAGKIDFITSVPAKQGKIDRVRLILENSEMSNYSTNVDCGILCVTRDYEPQKKAGSWENRAQNVNDVFGFTKGIHGHIVLVDDIITSGSTAMECVKILLEAGASKVSLLAIAATQSNIPTNSKLVIPCGSCDGQFKLRINSYNGTALWGCSSFPECTRTLNYFEGCSKLVIKEKQSIFDWGDI